MSTKKTLLICLAVLLVGAVVTAFIFMTEPTAERSGAVRETAMLVNVTGVEQGTFYPTIQAMGAVEPSQDITLSPRVGGQIVRISDAFTPGGYVRKGEVLLQIDPSDYQNVLSQRQSDLSQARSDFDIEQGRQNVARQDYELLSDSIQAANRALVLREPQLEAARARVQAAEAAVQQAELDLERTTIRAPFDAHILSRNANVGSQVAPGADLGRLVGLDAYWVVATVPQAQLRWLTFPGGGGEPSEVRIRNRTAWPDSAYRTGTLHRLVGALEDQTRLARVIVEVADPMGYRAGQAAGPPLMIGSYVEAQIEATPLTDVIRLHRDYVRDGDTVWAMEDSTLQIRNVDIVFRDATYAYIEGGLEGDTQVVTTNLATVVDGAPLRVENASPEPGPSEPNPLPEAASDTLAAGVSN